MTPGDADASAIEDAVARAARRLSATYFWPCQSHASLGPSSAVADIKGDGGTLWTSSQVTYGLRNTIAAARLCEAAHIKHRLGAAVGSRLLAAQGLHLACALPGVDYACELAHQKLADVARRLARQR